MPRFKSRLESLEGLEEQYHPFYAEKDGAYVLNLNADDFEGFVPKNKLDEFRNNNIEKAKEIETLKESLQQFEGIDPEEVEELRAKVETMGTQDTDVTDEKVNELIEKRFGRIRKGLEKEIETIKMKAEATEAARANAQTELENIQIFGQLRQAALDANAKKKALSHIENTARGIWKFDGGKPRAFDSDGTPMMGEHGDLTMSEWVSQLREDNDFLFEPSTGGGAAGSLDRETGERTISLNSGKNVIGENLEDFAKGNLRGV